jgi:hypothetical protein
MPRGDLLVVTLANESIRYIKAAAVAGACGLSYLLLAACPFVARQWWAFAMFGSFVLYLNSSPGRRGIALSLFAGAISLCRLRFFGGLYHPYTFVEDNIAALGAFAGAGCLFALASSCLLARSKRARSEAADCLLLCISLPCALILIDYVLLKTTTQLSFDRVLLACDGVLGMQPSYLVARIVESHPPALRVFRLVYDALPLAIACGYAASSRASAPWLAKSLILAGVIGRPLHFLVPAAGPRWALTGLFPAVLPAITAHWMRPFDLKAIFNCVPSLHLGWALLIFWQLRRGKSTVATVISAVFLACTAVSTLALGEHYLFDLIIAVPFTLMIEALCIRGFLTDWDRRRTSAALVGTALSAGLAFLIRSGRLLQFSAPAAWVLVAAILLLSVFLETRLVGAAKPDCI